MTPTYQTPDFRTYEPEIRKNAKGEMVSMTLCEELVEGRWEPFYSIKPVKA